MKCTILQWLEVTGSDRKWLEVAGPDRKWPEVIGNSRKWTDMAKIMFLIMNFIM